MGSYPIMPSLKPSSARTEELEIAIAEKYKLDFVDDGHLIIDKLPLKITPKDTTIVYGNILPDGKLDFKYEIVNDPDNPVVIDNPDSIIFL